ncbi:MAG: HEAT repeat domain-containing protein [Asgard group archaeon]|nr:HEAT repeat domain-containing protein [Asgard group archaeon]
MNLVESLMSELANANDSESKSKIILKMGEFKDDKILKKLVEILSSDEDNRVKSHAADAIIKIGGDEAVQNCLRLLRDNSWITRMKAAEILGELKNKKSTLPLVRILKNDSEVSVKEWAAIALGKIRDKKAIRPLIQTLLNEMSWEVRKESALALGKIKGKKAIGALTKAFYSDKECQVRWAAASALSIINDNNETKVLFKDLCQELLNIIKTEKDETKISAAAKTLGDIGNIEAAKTMFKTMKVSRELVRLEINLALSKMAKRYNYQNKEEFINILK